MIITKTPLRVSFFGGGSDLPQYYNYRPGLVISTTINRYIHIAANKCEPRHVRVVYSELEQADTVEDIKHTRAKAVLKKFNVQTGIEVVSFSDITTKGSGLGSSSSYTVGLINALSRMTYCNLNCYDLAKIACEIEIDILGEPIGKQDQYAAAFGGFNAIRFNSSDVEVSSIPINRLDLYDLSNSLMCFNTGITREASSVLSQQVTNLVTDHNALDTTSRMVAMAEDSLQYLARGKLDDFGSLLHDAWTEKKKLASGISNPHIDTMYETARNAGALGGKLLGAGGGGYMLFYVPVEYRSSVKNAMQEYKQFHFRFSDFGTTDFVQ
jgi:D-glycero-alpha-D-manno-heptose-7-phosphate kinase